MLWTQEHRRRDNIIVVRYIHVMHTAVHSCYIKYTFLYVLLHISSNGTTMDIRFASGPPFVLPWTSSPEFLYERITVVESRPGVLLHGMCSLCQWWCLSLPLVVMMSLSYTASISAGLAFINSLPVFWLDGDDALGAWLQLLMPKAKKKKVMLSCIICIPTFILYS